MARPPHTEYISIMKDGELMEEVELMGYGLFSVTVRLRDGEFYRTDQSNIVNPNKEESKDA